MYAHDFMRTVLISRCRFVYAAFHFHEPCTVVSQELLHQRQHDPLCTNPRKWGRHRAVAGLLLPQTIFGVLCSTSRSIWLTSVVIVGFLFTNKSLECTCIEVWLLPCWVSWKCHNPSWTTCPTCNTSFDSIHLYVAVRTRRDESTRRKQSAESGARQPDFAFICLRAHACRVLLGCWATSKRSNWS